MAQHFWTHSHRGPAGIADPRYTAGTYQNTIVDGAVQLPQHGLTMSENEYDKVRRSSRVFMRVRVVVAGKNSDNRRFREACETIVINAHGGLMYLNQPLAMNAILVVTNPFTQEEQESRIVFLGEAVTSKKGSASGIESSTPAPCTSGALISVPAGLARAFRSRSARANVSAFGETFPNNICTLIFPASFQSVAALAF